MNDIIQTALKYTVDKIDFEGAQKVHHGKVRDSFIFEKTRAIVVSDRISAFDFVLGTVPFKGQVLNQMAAWWFKKLDEIDVPHHLISTPDPNVSLVKNATVLPIEVIVRGYLTGSTKTSSWYAYQNLDRKICGLEMPEGMVKNQKFEDPIITPTTKPETGHDENITSEEVVSRGYVKPEIWEQAQAIALKMFAFGQQVAADRGLILVDTKYEMGLDSEGNLMVIDEVHTPDSSRYWVADSYEARMAAGEEPESLDKEFVRGKLVEAGYDVNSEEDPSHYLTDLVRAFAAQKYISLFEKMTGDKFVLPENLEAQSRIKAVLDSLVH